MIRERLRKSVSVTNQVVFFQKRSGVAVSFLIKTSFLHFGGPRKSVKKRRFAFLEDYGHARTSSGGSGSHRSPEIHQSRLVVLEDSEQSRFSLFAHAENQRETAQRFDVRYSLSRVFRTFVCFPHLLGSFGIRWSPSRSW